MYWSHVIGLSRLGGSWSLGYNRAKGDARILVTLKMSIPSYDSNAGGLAGLTVCVVLGGSGNFIWSAL